ncbi:hypothetical protein [Persicirhabdus sediminis]|uniref:Carbohydrate-binding family V/XII n=1 Tax=Persicirhabdus sediminis TaxID=454144 RepID=A0A8J7SIS9_9BACT|nr:hypothetical protein [Persicirhabdus sediminis]MBK1790844.1 hypothetical protein [Persicirhabdus sediminis]
MKLPKLKLSWLAAWPLAVTIGMVAATSTLAQEPATNSEQEANDIGDVSWPVSYQVDDYEVIFFSPQIDAWEDFKTLKTRMAASVRSLKKKDAEAAYGAVMLETTTVAVKEENVVHFGERKILALSFPDAESDEQKKQLEALMTKVVNKSTDLTMSLDSMVAAVDRAEVSEKDAEVSLDPPPIFYSETPAVLVNFMGDPSFKAVKEGDNSLLFATNTNWDLLMDGTSSQYYLLASDVWMQTGDVMKGPWAPAKSLPASFKSLPEDDNWEAVREALSLEPVAEGPVVFVSNQPGELLELDGGAILEPISGTKLMQVTNTENDLFFYPEEKNWYYLTAGRWFRSQELDRGWSAATFDLPEEFSKIPEDGKQADVLASVAGTSAADEAAVAAAIPQTATVNRADMTLEVAYDGEPQLQAIKGTTVQFITNTENDVFLVNNKYYCCYDGVWFEAPTANGTWVVCDNVAEEIYTIPAEHPTHNVTYVNVYNSTPTTVDVGYTTGYTGGYLWRGLLFFGAGYWLGNNHSHYHWYRPAYIGWGCGARYSWYRRGYYRGSYRGYGPWGGCVRPVPYHRGRYHRAHYRYGDRYGSSWRPAYNPTRPRPGYRPGRPGARPVPTPYGSGWNKGVKPHNRDWANNKNRLPATADKRPSKPSQGFRPTARPSTRDNVFVGKDGKVYKKDKGNWQTRESGKWKDTKLPNNPSTRPTQKPTTRPSQPGVKPGQKPTTRPTQPGVKPGQPTTRPSQPTTRPSQPTTRPSQPTTRPSQPTTRPSQPTTRPSQPTTRPSQPTTRPSQPTTRPSQPTTRPSQPTTRPSQPTTRPSQPTTRPSQPTTRPSQPTTRPSQPTTRPSQPTTRPSQPTTRPTPKPATRPAPKPATRPAPKPATRPAPKPATRPAPKPASRPAPKPAARPTYNNSRPTSSKLNFDSRARQQSSQRSVQRTRSVQRAAPQRSSSFRPSPSRSAPSRPTPSRSGSRPSPAGRSRR